ncbi:MAG: hypothetical protein LBV71_10785 [Prevotella sp.]|nr:hypothetical protein [Prevotella sp.]
MDFLQCMDNFPWNRFATVYETSSKCLKDPFIKIFKGDGEASDYKFIIDRLEHQETLYRITPWGLKFYICLLEEGDADRNSILQNIKILFEAANYDCQVNTAMAYKPTKGNLAKAEIIKQKLFDDDFDGKMDTDFLKIFKSIDRNFMQIFIMEFIQQKKQLLEEYTSSTNSNISANATALINSINNPKEYKFGK